MKRILIPLVTFLLGASFGLGATVQGVRDIARYRPQDMEALSRKWGQRPYGIARNDQTSVIDTCPARRLPAYVFQTQENRVSRAGASVPLATRLHNIQMPAHFRHSLGITDELGNAIVAFGPGKLTPLCQERVNLHVLVQPIYIASVSGLEMEDIPAVALRIEL